MRGGGVGKISREQVGTVVGVALVIAMGAINVVRGAEVLGILVVGPLVVSSLADSGSTAMVALFTVFVALVSAVLNHTLGTFNQTVRLAGVAAGSAFCVVVARWREAREARLAQVVRVAEAAQRAILRPVPAVVGNVAFAARYLSAAEEAVIGGDLYDVVPSKWGVRVVVGDVRGKGLEAVRLSATVLGSFRESAVVQRRLPQVTVALDRAIAAELGAEDFVTAVVAQFSGGKVDVVNCGHYPPIMVSEGDVTLLAAEPTPPLGLGPAFEARSFAVRPGSRLLFYTDGLIEARGEDRRFYTMPPDVRRALAVDDLDKALDALVESVLDHVGHRLDDDLALLLAEVRSP